MPNNPSRTPSFDYLSEDVLSAINEIDPSTPKVPMQPTTPSSSPSKRRIRVTDGASDAIRRVAHEREQALEESSESPQPASDQQGQPHTLGIQFPPPRTSRSPGPFGLPPHNSGQSGQPGSVPPPASTSPIPFVYPPPNGQAPIPAQNAAQAYPGSIGYPPAYPHPGAAYGYQYLYGAHSMPPPPPHVSASGHPAHTTPPPLPPAPHTSMPPPLPPPPIPSSRHITPSHPDPIRPDASVADSESISVAPTNKINTTSTLVSEHPAVVKTSRHTPSSNSGQEVEATKAKQTASEPVTAELAQDGESSLSDDDSLFGGDELPGLESFQAPAARASGRPSKEKIQAADDVCKKIAAYIVKKCTEGTLETTLVYDRLCGKVLRSKKKLHAWNEYESYIMAPQNIHKELGRLGGTDLAWDGVSKPTLEQRQEAWRLFKLEHGDEHKTMMEMWAMVKDIVTTQTQGERKRDYMSVQNQLIDLINWVYNRYNIHIWAIIAGGLSRSDQTFSTLCELNASKGFSKVLGLEPEDVNPLYQAFIYYQNALKVSNQQFAAMGAQRGLKVTGPGVDEELPVKTLPTTFLPPPGPQAATPRKGRKEDVRAVVKARTDECLAALDRSFTRKTLPWSTLAIECIDLGIQVINYPLGTLYPWEDVAPKPAGKKVTNRGIKNLPPAHQAKLIDACRVDHEHRLTLVLAESICLEAGDLPVFVSVPDSTGNTTKTFAKDIPGCLEAVKALRGTREKKVKFEEAEPDLPTRSTSGTRPSHSCTTKKPKPTYGAPADSEEETDEQDEINSEEETPQPKRKASTKKAPATVSEGPSTELQKASARSTSKAPSKVETFDDRNALSFATPKRSASSKVISATDFDKGGFQVGGFGSLKRGSSDTKAEEGPAGKRLKQTDLQTARPSSTLGHPAVVQEPKLAGEPPRAPQQPPPPQASSGSGPSNATPPPSLQPPVQWQAQAPSPSNAPYPVQASYPAQYPPAMYGMPPPHPHALPPTMNIPPEMIAMLQSFMAGHQLPPQPGASSGYQPPAGGPGR
ncbi:hypothetical protein PQX77_005751 [Marasmius sp. AFHP31]|nr:hypothetical protein PQX77_005751 [Marasmius sp. AFHP31]